MDSVFILDREEIRARAYEDALRSAFAQGSALTGFRFTLPRHDDVVTLIDGTRGLRGDVHGLGYDARERSLHREFLLEDLTLTVPPLFLDDQETILEAHRADLEEIARGLIRDARNHNIASVPPEAFHAFSRTALAFHEALLAVTATLFSLHEVEQATHLMHGAILPNGLRDASLFAQFLQSEEELLLAARRLQHSHLVHVIESGTQAQRVNFLTSGRNLNIEPAFFTYHLERG